MIQLWGFYFAIILNEHSVISIEVHLFAELYDVYVDLVCYDTGTFLTIGSIHTEDLLGVSYYVNYSLNNGFYCTKWAHSHFFVSWKFNKTAFQ